jgi:hypothetical protein
MKSQLAFTDEAYRNKITRGLSFVLNGILASIIVTVLGMVVQMAMPGRPELQFATMGAQLLVSVAMIMGYWMFTEPAMGRSESELSEIGRRFARTAIVVQVVLQVLQIVVIAAFPGIVVQPGKAFVFSTGFIAIAAVGLLALLVAAGQFVAVMLYTRGLAERVPDAHIQRRAGVYLWLIPLLSTVGILACGLGPLVALVLYWNLLDRLRKQLRAINATGSPATLPGAFI